MFIKQMYTTCLAGAAYYIESGNEAAIIDPMRDIEEYLLLAKERNATIKYIFETHLHADFVSGHLDLSKQSGAPIIFGPQTETKFEATIATDHQIFPLGKINIEVLHTPGHTIESTCYLLKDENGKDSALFTGDTLFVGDVGRPDLVGTNITIEEMASMLYDSLQYKILPLADDVVVYPAHGPGSSCGKNIGIQKQSTVGEQKATNYALQPQTKDEFIKAVTEGLTLPPNHFSINAKINKEGYQSLEEILTQTLQPITIEECKQAIEKDAIILDTRTAEQFTEGFITGSVFIGLEGKFAEWAGSLLPYDKEIILVTEAGKEKESIIRLARVGFSKIKGYLNGGFGAWKRNGESTDMIINVDADEVAMDIPFDPKMLIVDVRKEIEYGNGHVKGAVNIPLTNLLDPASMANIEDTDNLYIHCQSGYRSVIASSILKNNGLHNLRNITGGWNMLKDQKGIQTQKEAAILN